MSTALLGKVADLNPRLTDKPAISDLVSFVPMSAVSAESAGVTAEEARPYAEVAKGYTSFISGDILVAKITPCFENGKIAQAILSKRWGFGSTEFHVVRPHPQQLDGRYTHHFLRLESIRVAGERRMTGSGGQRRVPENYLSNIEIPLPPLAEQRRIAEVLDRAEALRAKRRAALVQLDSLTQSLFLDLFGDPATNRKNLRKSKLGDLLKLKSGEFLSADQMTPNGDVPVFGGNGINGYHDRFLFDEEKIVIGRVGAYCGCVHITPPKSWITDNALYVSQRSNDAEFIYLTHALTHAKLNQYAGQSGQPLVSGSRIYPVEVLVPPLPLQREFACRVTVVEKMERVQLTSLAELDALFASLQHSAFRGEL